VQGYLNEIALHGGGVMLMHDKSQKSIDLLAQMIPLLKAQGYQFVTLDHLPELDAL
jgi:peptidoglycan/xylan/chitin deacetylase (PgdA/CDA1 family)